MKHGTGTPAAPAGLKSPSEMAESGMAVS